MNYSKNDLTQFETKGISLEQIEKQLNNFKNGFPYMNIVKAATVEDGIVKSTEEETSEYIADYENALKNIQVAKFVPASGAASRMFKDLFEFVNNDEASAITTSKELEEKGFDFTSNFFKNLGNFAFIDDFVKTLSEQNVDIKKSTISSIVELFLSEEGLNYGNLPKGMLKFHNYKEGARTSMEEHWTEGAMYANDKDNVVHLHFTVSPEHKALFSNLISEKLSIYEEKYAVKFKIEMSEQKSATDTIAVDMNNEPFRKSNGIILFRPAGHGALIENLNDIDADIIFVKNIDNVVPDRMKETTVDYKKALAGLLYDSQQRIFDYLKLMEADNSNISDKKFEEISVFVEKELCILPPENFKQKNKSEQISDLKEILNRPIRICGMVKNEGEPGGGPFWATNPNGSVSLQVVEGSQIDAGDSEKMNIVNNATHFNPVDLVCGVKNYKGEKFNLTEFRDMETGFISEKSLDGESLKAQELPGLWNGAMSNWITIFMEVPIETFNPVKTINDLLRPQHQ